ncbi:MAG: HlyC/CorC family transporter [Acidimicrobiia bacterium]|nr:HlyC/CorC family transporter [Acidimicrobiia bacterium]
MNATNVAYIIILGFAAVASGFFSGSETALIGIGKERVRQLEGRRGQRVAQLVSDPDRLLSTLLVANNLVNILGAAIATTLFITLVGEEWGPWVATAVVTAVVLVVGEITPKSLATRYPERFSLAVAPIIWQLSRILGPVARMFIAITRGLFRLFRLPAQSDVSAVTEEDVRALVALGLEEGEIEAVEHEIIHALFDLADRPVREVMTPRVDVISLKEPVSASQAIDAVSTSGHSRYPVIGNDLDELRGMLYVKDLLRIDSNEDSSRVDAILRTPNYIPETTSVLSVIQMMRRERFQLAVVTDEHGGVEGLVTIKDLMSELVGELQDEYDPGSPSVVKIGARSWMADGRLDIEDVEEALGISLPDGPYSTIGGLYLAVAGHIPDEGDQAVVESVRLTVLQMDRNRIGSVRIELLAGRGII